VNSKKACIAVAVIFIAAVIAYEKAPEHIAQQIKKTVNSYPLRVRLVIAWRVLFGRI